jgi:hypothetical protein
MGAELSDHGHGDTGGRVTFAHHTAEDGAAGEQQEKLTGESEGAQGTEGKVFGHTRRQRQAIGDNDQQGGQCRREDDINTPEGEPDKQSDAGQKSGIFHGVILLIYSMLLGYAVGAHPEAFVFVIPAQAGIQDFRSLSATRFPPARE